MNGEQVFMNMRTVFTANPGDHAGSLARLGRLPPPTRGGVLRVPRGDKSPTVSLATMLVIIIGIILVIHPSDHPSDHPSCLATMRTPTNTSHFALVGLK